jgi:hypothetical protein
VSAEFKSILSQELDDLKKQISSKMLEESPTVVVACHSPDGIPLDEKLYIKTIRTEAMIQTLSWVIDQYHALQLGNVLSPSATLKRLDL